MYACMHACTYTHVHIPGLEQQLPRTARARLRSDVDIEQVDNPDETVSILIAVRCYHLWDSRLREKRVNARKRVRVWCMHVHSYAYIYTYIRTHLCIYICTCESKKLVAKWIIFALRIADQIILRFCTGRFSWNSAPRLSHTHTHIHIINWITKICG